MFPATGGDVGVGVRVGVAGVEVGVGDAVGLGDVGVKVGVGGWLVGVGVGVTGCGPPMAAKASAACTNP